MIGNIIAACVVILIGVTLFPTISEQLTLASTDSNLTGASTTMLQLVPLFFALAIAFSAFAIAYQGFRGVEYDETPEEIGVAETPKRTGEQTYEDFVRERMKVEEMMR